VRNECPRSTFGTSSGGCSRPGPYTSAELMERVRAVVVGGGQASLATSHELTRAGVEHVVLERGHVGQTWRDRWDSFCLVTPNWTVQLPGGAYEGGRSRRLHVQGRDRRLSRGISRRPRGTRPRGRRGAFGGIRAGRRVRDPDLRRRRSCRVPGPFHRRLPAPVPPPWGRIVARPICFRSTSTTSGTPRRCMSFDAGAFASSQVKPGESRSCRELRGGARRLAPGPAGCTTFRNGAARRGASHTWQATRWPSNCCPLSRGSSEPARTRLICLISSLGVWLNELSGDVTRRSTCMRVT